jgi:hypothetical protein
MLETATGAPRERAILEVRIGRKRKPSALGYLVRDVVPLPEDQRGVAISTLGKIIRRGWDWLGVTPATPDLIGGTIELPALAECLTLNKAEFIRSGPRGMTYLAYRKAIQNAVSTQLAEWGDARDATETARRRIIRPVERDLERVLIDLADDFPLLGTLVAHRAGGSAACRSAARLLSSTGGPWLPPRWSRVPRPPPPLLQTSHNPRVPRERRPPRRRWTRLPRTTLRILPTR